MELGRLRFADVSKLKWIILLAVCVMTLLWPTLHAWGGLSADKPSSSRGVLDLSQWDFERDGVVTLDGEWALHWSELLETAGAAGAGAAWRAGTADVPLSGEADGHEAVYVAVPDAWTNYKVDGRYLPGQGYATYRLKVVLPESADADTLAFKSLGISTAYRLFVNGEELAASGAVAADAGEGVARHRPFVALYTGDGRALDIVIQVSNYAYDRGGIWYPILLGDQAQVLSKQMTGIGQDVFLSGCMLILGVYHIVLYALRRVDKFDLYYGVACLLVCVRTLFIGEMFITLLLPDISMKLVVFVEYMTYCWGMYCFTLFFQSFYPLRANVLFGRIQLALTVLFTLIVLVLPMPVYTAALQWFHYVVAASCVNGLLIVFRALLHRETGARVLIGCAVLLSLAIVHDMLYSNSVIFIADRQLSPLALLVFVLSQAFISARRSVDAYRTISEMSRKLMSLDQLKDEFLAKTSHELKTPLHGILNISQLMLEGTSGPVSGGQRHHLTVIASVTRRLTHLINDLLDYSRMKHEDVVLHMKPVNVRVIVGGCLDVFRHFVTGKPVRLSAKLADGLPLVLADADRLTQILFNLLGNAVKFTERGDIEVSAALEKGELMFAVRDSGIGIAAEQLESIFLPYERGGVSDKDGYGGTGLGLAITRKLVELHGGRLWARSEVGRGATFYFTIPLRDAEPQPDGARAASAAGLPGMAEAAVELAEGEERAEAGVGVGIAVDAGVGADGTYTLLVVDDEPTNVLVMQQAFSGAQYRVIAASSGRAALDALERERRVDIVILDIMMPGMSGLDVCRIIRQRYSLSELPVLLVTVHNQPHDVQEGFAAGANDYVTKPFEHAELRARVGTLLALRQSVRELMRLELDALQAQIKPHFLYNTINTIVSFCRYDADRAAELLVELSEYLRGSFDFHNRGALVPLSREIGLVRSYLTIEQARFGDKLHVNWDADFTDSCVVPPLVVQPLVENAVRHGLSPKKDGGAVTVSVREEGGSVRICVSDNGVGIPAERLELLLRKDGPRPGVGLANINRRLQALYGTELVVESTVGEGTRICMSLPKSEGGAYG